MTAAQVRMLENTITKSYINCLKSLHGDAWKSCQQQQ